MSKINIYHFHGGRPGGVDSVIGNMLKFSNNPLVKNHVIKTINTDLFTEAIVEKTEGAISEQVFYYSAKWNFYYTCKQLAKLLPNADAIIVAHDWLELGMMSCLGLQNPVIFFVHGDYSYYYQLAEKHEKVIDMFIPVADNIAIKLKNILPYRAADISYLRFPVPEVFYNDGAKKNGNIIFVGRCETEKGYHLLPIIAKRIVDKGINIQWHIAGNEDEHSNDAILWDERIKVSFLGNIPNIELLKLLHGMQVIILPSIAEGMPVSLIEAMKAGVIPVVNDIPGGIQELIVNNETGYKITGNEVDGYVDKIIEVVGNDNTAKYLRQNCITVANQWFDPINNTNTIEEAFVTLNNIPRKKKLANKVYGSRMDEPWIPNMITRLYRQYRRLPNPAKVVSK